MTRTIKYQESKAERKREREKIGRLRDQRITPGTKDRYEAALQQVAAFAGVSVPRLLASSGLDDLLSSFIEKGTPRPWPAMRWHQFSITALR